MAGRMFIDSRKYFVVCNRGSWRHSSKVVAGVFPAVRWGGTHRKHQCRAVFDLCVAEP